MMNLNFPNITLKKKVFCCKYKTFQVSLSVRESFCLRLFRSTNCFFSCSCAAAGGRASFFFSSSFVFFICPYFPPFFLFLFTLSLFLSFASCCRRFHLRSRTRHWGASRRLHLSFLSLRKWRYHKREAPIFFLSLSLFSHSSLFFSVNSSALRCLSVFFFSSVSVCVFVICVSPVWFCLCILWLVVQLCMCFFCV